MTVSPSPQKSSRQALWFLIVGAGAAFVHFLVLVGLVNWLNLSPVWANCGAFLVAFVVSFSGHCYLTFRPPSSTQKPSPPTIPTIPTLTSTTTQTALALTARKLGKWFVSSVAGFALNQGLFVLGITWLGEHYYVIIWFMVTLMVTVMTFLLGKLWAFR